MNLDRKLAARWQPKIDRFRRRPFFEGWYMKLVSACGESIAVIPGMYRGTTNHYDFVQVFDGCTGKVDSVETSVVKHQEQGQFSIGSNDFFPNGCSLDFTSPAMNYQGHVIFEELQPWQGIWRHPAMGWFSWLPGLECYHSVLSFKHRLSGSLICSGKTICFDGGWGYMEKTWGVSFPTAWIWSQGHHFDNSVESFFFSVSKVPFGGRTFNGLTVGVLTNTKLYRWGTWRGERATVSGDSDVEVWVHGWQYDLRLKWPGVLPATPALPNVLVPTAEGLRPGVTEWLNQSIELEIFCRRSGRTIIKATGIHVALDLANVDLLFEGS